MLIKPRVVGNYHHLFLFSSCNIHHYTSSRSSYPCKKGNIPFSFGTNINKCTNKGNRVTKRNMFFCNFSFLNKHSSLPKREYKNFMKDSSKNMNFLRNATKWRIYIFNKKGNFINRIKNNINVKLGKHLNSEGIYLKDIYKILKHERKYLGLAMACLLLSSLGQLFFPICISKIINTFGGKEDSLNYLTKEVYKTVFLIFCISTFSFFRIFFIETSIEKITKRLRTTLFEKILNQEQAFFNNQKTGELINRLSNDIEISSKILIHLSFAIRNFIAAVVGGISALHISPSKLVTSFLLPVCACLLIGTSYGKFVKKISIKKQEKLSSCMDFASEKIYNISSVRLLNGEAYEKKEFKKYLNELYAIGKKYSLVKAGNHFIFFSIISLFILHLIYYGNYLIANQYINSGNLFSLIMYSLLSGSGIQGLMHSVTDIQKCIGSCAKVLQIINLDTKEIGKGWDQRSLDFMKSQNFSIRFDNVSFSYEKEENEQKENEQEENEKEEEEKNKERVKGKQTKKGKRIEKTGMDTKINITKKKKKDIPYCSSDPSAQKKKNTHNCYALKNVSFLLPHNKSVAFVGESGSGKSTILNLITKKNNIKEGTIHIGDFDINEINSAAVRSLLGVITQNPFLFNGSIKYNILYPFKAYIEMLNEQIEFQQKKIERTENDLSQMKEMKHQSEQNKYCDNKEAKELIQLLQNRIEQTKQNMENAEKEQLQQIYKDFYIHHFLNKYDKYDEINAGVNGLFLSGGERQRVYIAQNILKDKKILILDEPTSALDKLSEDIINEALRKYMKNKTTIIFTHRLALLKFVDYIGVLKEGQIIQFDMKENVLKNPCTLLKRILRTSEY